MLIGHLAANGYQAALWRLVVGKALILTGSKLTDDELRAIGGPPEGGLTLRLIAIGPPP